MQKFVNKGLSQEQLNAFPVIEIKSISHEYENCSICLEDWKLREKAKILGCMHRFHPECIDSWLKEKNLCPNCKENQT